MPGKMPAEYWREYRKKHREKLNAQQAERRKNDEELRKRRHAAETERRRRRREGEDDSWEIPQLYEYLRSGRYYSFWEDELKMDLEQERALAKLEGKDQEEAVRKYRSKEYFQRKFLGLPLKDL